MVTFDLTLKQIYAVGSLHRQAIAAAKKGELGMIIAQIILPDMVCRAEFVEHEKAEKIIKAMNKPATDRNGEIAVSALPSVGIIA